MEETLTASEIKHQLAYFCGSTEFFTNRLTKSKYTEGVKFLATSCKANWFVSDVLTKVIEFPNEEFISIVLKLNDPEKPSKGCTITYGDGNGTTLDLVKISFTDFPLDEIKLYYTGDTLLLPSEY